MERTSLEKSNSTEHGPGKNAGFVGGSAAAAAGVGSLSLSLLSLLPFLAADFVFVTGGGGIVPQVTVPRRSARTDDVLGNLTSRLVDLTASVSVLMSASPLTNLIWSFFAGDTSAKKSPVPLPDVSSLLVRMASISSRPLPMRLSRSPVTPSAAKRGRASSLGERPTSDST